jgi:hypothetical protein
MHARTHAHTHTQNVKVVVFSEIIVVEKLCEGGASI